MENSEQKSNHDERPEFLTLFLDYCMSLILLFLGFGWRHDIKTKGYFITGHARIPIVGEEGLITVYAVIIGGISILLYSIYLTILRFKK